MQHQQMRFYAKNSETEEAQRRRNFYENGANPQSSGRGLESENVYEFCVQEPTNPNRSSTSTKFVSKRVFLVAVTFVSLLAIAAVVLAALSFIQETKTSKESVNAGRFLQTLTDKNIASSCQELRNKGVTQTGIYQIQPNRAYPAIYTYCDMTSDGGGWTLVASVHENNINGKCTVGDKWSSEQSAGENNFTLIDSENAARGSWENFEIFGDIKSVTSNDYKNDAYSELKVSDVMIWHVPNDVSTANLDRESTFKYFTRGNALSGFNSSLREFYTQYFKMKRKPRLSCSTTDRAYIEDIDANIALRYRNIRSAVPRFYNYRYDGIRGTTGNSISDGGQQMYSYPGGNRVSFLAGNNMINVDYGRYFCYETYDLSVISGAFHPFVFLAWVGNKTESPSPSFGIQVSSTPGGFGERQHSTDTDSFRFGDYLIWYRVFQVYGSNFFGSSQQPSICEVYFYIANTQKWGSVIGNTVVANWSTSTDRLLNRVDFHNFRNVFAGYTLLSQTYSIFSRRQIPSSSIEEALQQLVSIIDDVPYLRINVDENMSNNFTFPVSFAKGDARMLRSRLATSQRQATRTGYLQMGVYNALGYPYPLCPGVRLENSGSPSMNCIGGIYTTPPELRNVCGDFAGWGGNGLNLTQDEPTSTARSLSDIHSSILIFTRGKN